MNGEGFKAVLSAIMPEEVVMEAARRLGVLKRGRKIDPFEIVWAMVLSGGTEDCGRLASALRALVKAQGEHALSRSAFYQWFDAEAELLFSELAKRACSFVESMPKHLPGILAGRKDWRAVDSTVTKLPRQLITTFPGTGDYASLKVHKVYSLGAENIVDYHITSGRDHDGPQLSLDESWRGMGLVVDLGYASFRLFREARAFDVAVVIRLKEGWRLQPDEASGESVRHPSLGDVDPAMFLQDRQLNSPPGTTVDLDVIVGGTANAISLRLVGVQTENKGLLLFLTNLPRSSHSADDVATLYRLRWNIELDNKLNKSAFRLDQVTAQSPASARILVHAAIIASMVANAFAHQELLDRGFVDDKTPTIKEGPPHPMLVAKAIATSAHAIAAMLADPETPLKQWNSLASAIRRLSIDPNWRRKPSVLDRVKGRVAPPGRARRSTAKGAEAQISVAK